MNERLQKFARDTMKENLPKLPADSQRTFKLMYGRANGLRSVEDAEAMTVEAVVDEIPEERLDWAMQQVQNTLKGQGKT
jgi:hypothetical protein